MKQIPPPTETFHSKFAAAAGILKPFAKALYEKSFDRRDNTARVQLECLSMAKRECQLAESPRVRQG